MNIEELYRTYFDIVYRYIRSVSRDGALAEEVTQETFFKALKKQISSVMTAMCGCGFARLQRIRCTTI
mgnify:FL=1